MDKTKEEQEQMQDDPAQTNEELDTKSGKYLLIGIALIIGIFIFFFIGKWLAGTPTGMTISDLHTKNLQGEAGEKDYLYNGFSFVYKDNLWYTQVQGGGKLIEIPLHNGPRELEDVPIEGTVDERFLQKSIYITFNPKDTNLQYVALGVAELSLNLANGMGITPVAACDRNVTTACEARPIITCDNGEPTIYVRQADTAKVQLDGNCVTIQGRDEYLVKAIDKFLLRMYGVI